MTRLVAIKPPPPPRVRTLGEQRSAVPSVAGQRVTVDAAALNDLRIAQGVAAGWLVAVCDAATDEVMEAVGAKLDAAKEQVIEAAARLVASASALPANPHGRMSEEEAKELLGRYALAAARSGSAAPTSDVDRQVVEDYLADRARLIAALTAQPVRMGVDRVAFNAALKEVVGTVYAAGRFERGLNTLTIAEVMDDLIAVVFDKADAPTATDGAE